MDLGSVKALADVVSSVHTSDQGGRLETFVFVWVLVRRYTTPITAAIKNLVQANETNAHHISENKKILDNHEARLINHEGRLVVLETDKQPKGE